MKIMNSGIPKAGIITQTVKKLEKRTAGRDAGSA